MISEAKHNRESEYIFGDYDYQTLPDRERVLLSINEEAFGRKGRQVNCHGLRKLCKQKELDTNVVILGGTGTEHACKDCEKRINMDEPSTEICTLARRYPQELLGVSYTELTRERD